MRTEEADVWEGRYATPWARHYQHAWQERAAEQHLPAWLRVACLAFGSHHANGADEGLGLDIQRSAIETWARARRHRIVGWCSDEGVSGSNGLDTREALPTALELLKAGDADALVVYRLDRLARDLIVQETLLAEIKRLGSSIFSTADSESAYLADDPDDPSRRLIRQVLGAVSEYERSMIALRLRSGRKMKARQGGYAYGSPPMGFRATSGSLVEDPLEQAALARAVELREEGLSLRLIAETLGREGHKPKRGGDWHPTTLSRALRRASVAGSTPSRAATASNRSQN